MKRIRSIEEMSEKRKRKTIRENCKRNERLSKRNRNKKAKLDNPTEDDIQEIVSLIRNGTYSFEDLGESVCSNDRVVEALLETEPLYFTLLSPSQKNNAKNVFIVVKADFAWFIRYSSLKDDAEFINQLASISGEALRYVNRSLITHDVLKRAVLGNQDIGGFIILKCAKYMDLVKLLLKNERYCILDHINPLSVAEAYELLESVPTINGKMESWSYISLYVGKIRDDDDIIVKFLKHDGSFFKRLRSCKQHRKEYQLLAAKQIGVRNIHKLIFEECGYNQIVQEYNSWYEYIRTVSERIGVKECTEFTDVVFKFNK
jgi:hypothetical protein